MKFLNYIECILNRSKELKRFTSCSENSIIKFMLWSNLSEVNDHINEANSRKR